MCLCICLPAYLCVSVRTSVRLSFSPCVRVSVYLCFSLSLSRLSLCLCVFLPYSSPPTPLSVFLAASLHGILSFFAQSITQSPPYLSVSSLVPLPLVSRSHYRSGVECFHVVGIPDKCDATCAATFDGIFSQCNTAIHKGTMGFSKSKAKDFDGFQVLCVYYHRLFEFEAVAVLQLKFGVAVCSNLRNFANRVTISTGACKRAAPVLSRRPARLTHAHLSSSSLSRTAKVSYTPWVKLRCLH